MNSLYVIELIKKMENNTRYIRVRSNILYIENKFDNN